MKAYVTHPTDILLPLLPYFQLINMHLHASNFKSSYYKSPKMAAYIIRHLFSLGNLGICVSPLAIYSIGLYFAITPAPSKMYPLFGVPVSPSHGRHHTIAHKSHIIGARAHTISTPTIPYHQIVLHHIPTPPAFLTQPQPISSNINAIFIVNDNQDPSIRVLYV